jgi:hypothetical protein
MNEVKGWDKLDENNFKINELKRDIQELDNEINN